MIMLAEASCICFVMRKGKIIRHIVDHFAEPPPVNSLVTLIRSDICQFFHPVLDIFKCSVDSCLLVIKDGLISGRMLPRQKAFL